MMQTSAATLISARPATDSQEPALLDPLLRLAGDLRNTRALIVADHALELMCGLLRRGCLAATTVRIGAKPDEADFDLVLIPYATAVGSDDELIRLARGCLMPNGRVIAGARNGREAIALARRLRLNGFTDIRSTTQPGRTLLRATLRSVS
jgi:hypothetical protein